ncbi:hypothetical protein B7463_g1541, partial [Scytalidium lignicola]
MDTDTEKTNPQVDTELVTRGSVVIVHEADEQYSDGLLARLRRLEAAMDVKLGMESEAIVRKLPEHRIPLRWREQMSMIFLWASGTMNISCFATGFLGWQFGLDLTESILIIIFGSLLGASTAGYCATFGPGMGLRQMSVSRYAFGWYPNKLIAVLNTVQNIGWCAVSCISCGFALQAVADGGISLAVGVVITGLVSLVISFIGLRAILVFERYAWSIYFVVFVIIIGEASRYSTSQNPSPVTGSDKSAALLSLLAITYGSSASWVTVSSDYFVLYPADINRFRVFISTALGMAIPTSIGMIAGAIVASGMNSKLEWIDTYENEGLGFLVQDFLYPSAFAKFLLVLLVLSGININILNLYSSGISCQQLARPLSRIPRFIWTLLSFAVVMVLALVGRNKLNTYLQNFLSLLGYWCTGYFVILLSEHTFIRKGSFTSYNLETWNNPSGLPHGIAAVSAFSLGAVAWVMGMSETWYVGPLAKLIGSSGGDVGNEFTLVVTSLSYLPLRVLELKYFVIIIKLLDTADISRRQDKKGDTNHLVDIYPIDPLMLIQESFGMRKLIIDTDPGVDDTLALLYVLSLPAEFEVLLMSLTFGNISLKQCFCNAYTILNTVRKYGLPGSAAAGGDTRIIPLALGQDGPLFTEEAANAAHFHGGDGLGGTHLSHQHLTPPDWESLFLNPASAVDNTSRVGLPFKLLARPAYEEILSVLDSQEPQTVTILAIGPLGNIAKAAMTDPVTFSRVKEVVVMGGAIYHPGNANPFAEFNTFADPEAAAIVFSLTNPQRSLAMPTKLAGFDVSIFRELQRGVKVTLLPLDITERHYIREDEWEECCRGSSLAGWVQKVCVAYFNSNKVLGENGALHKAFFPHDPLCVWYILHADEKDKGHELFKIKTMDLRVETEGQWTRGMCCVDRRPKDDISEFVKIDSEWVDPGSWLDSSMGNAVGVLQETPGRKEWVNSFCRTLFGTETS